MVIIGSGLASGLTFGTANVQNNALVVYTANLQHAIGTDGANNYTRQTNVLLADGVDLVCVQEKGTSDTGWNANLSSAGFVQAIYRENDPSTADGNAIWYRSNRVTVIATFGIDLSSGAIGWNGFTNVDKSAVAAFCQINGRKFYVVCTHLAWSAGADSDGSTFSAIRVAQITTLMDWIAKFLTGGFDIILAGDMNFGPDYPKNPSGLQIQGILERGYQDMWREGMARSIATAVWGDRNSDGQSDMPISDLLTRTHDTRRIDYFFLRVRSRVLSLLAIDMPDLRETCPHALVAGGTYPACTPEVTQLGDTPDDFGVRPSDHNWIKTTFAIAAPSGIILQDSFTDTDGTDLDDHTGEVATWLIHTASGGGLLEITSNRVHKDSQTATAIFYANHADVASMSMDVTFEILSAAATNASILFRLQTGADSYYNFRYNQATGAWDFRKTVASVASAIATFSETFSVGDIRNIHIEAVGSVFNIWVGGVRPASFTNVSDTSFSTGKTGIRMPGSLGPSSGIALRDVFVVALQVISPTGLASALAFGSPTLVQTGLTISPTGLVSGLAFGTAKVNQHIVASGIASAEAFGTPEINQSIGVVGVPSGVAFGTAKVNQAVVAASVPSAEAFGVPQVNLKVIPGGLASALTFGTARLNQKIVAAGVVSSEAIGTATVQRGNVNVSPSGIASALAFGNPIVQQGVFTIIAIGLTSEFAIGTAILSSGNVNLSPSGLASAEGFGTPDVSPGAITITVTGVASGLTFGVARLGLKIVASGVSSAQAFGIAQLFTGSFIIPTGLASGLAFGSTSVLGGGIVSPSPDRTISPNRISRVIAPSSRRII
jgi:endonuclease/exonuclease/phosphatase family metal-dependent hydrolase